ncbi:MAG: hypothetical protein WC348_01525 [Patescibacteria group bacterium]|jgi:hypothetical protein
METERSMPPQEIESNPKEQRLLSEEEVSQEVESARNKGKSKTGYPRVVPGTGRRGEITKGPHPHDKPRRKDWSRRETIRGRE